LIGQMCAIDEGVPHFNAPGGWCPANIRINFIFPETRGIVLLDAVNRTIISSFIWTKHRNVTDGQTDRIALASTALCIASNADAL